MTIRSSSRRRHCGWYLWFLLLCCSSKSLLWSVKNTTAAAAFLTVILPNTHKKNGPINTTWRHSKAGDWKNNAASSMLQDEDTDNDNGSGGSGVLFTTFPLSLQHLKNIEWDKSSDDEDHPQQWTTEKIMAWTGALVMGILAGGIVEWGTGVLETSTDETSSWSLLAAALGTGLGYNSLGGLDLAKQAQTPINGGYDAKLIADRPNRIRAILEYLQQQNIETKEVTEDRMIRPDVLKYVHMVHDPDYVENLKSKCASTDRPIRLNPRYARTLIDDVSYDAALMAASTWMDAVDMAVSYSSSSSSSNKNHSVSFVLTRPPSHHACRAKGMGGCLLNSVAIAAHYALDALPSSSSFVGILDIDAHHGNGIAHCIQENPRIRLVSLHEEEDGSKYMFRSNRPRPEDDPRSPSSDDGGPLNNICNLNLPSKSTWKEYEPFLDQALEYLQGVDIVLVAAGMDALEADWSSSLRLQPDDYRSIGLKIRQSFGHRVALGLEGGYDLESMPKAIQALASAWGEG